MNEPELGRTFVNLGEHEHEHEHELEPSWRFWTFMNNVHERCFEWAVV